MKNNYEVKLTRLWLATSKKKDGMPETILRAVICPWGLRSIHSLAFRFLIAIAPNSVPFSATSKLSEIWRLVIQLKQQLLEIGKLSIWGEKWTWAKGDFAPRAVALKRVRRPRKMFTF